jgi:restriction system protein
MMQAWIIRSLRQDGYEKLAFDREFVAIGWAATGDLMAISDQAQIRQAVRAGYPFVERESADSYAEQLFQFRVAMTQGDLVLLFRRSTPDVAVGWIVGNYQYRTDLPGDIRHVRSVRWVRLDLSRALVERELIAVPTLAMVWRIGREEIIGRIRELIESDAPASTIEDALVSPTVSEELKPFADLQRNLNYARSLATAGQHLAQLEVGAFEVSDVFRAAWVQGVAGLDHWVRQEVRIRMRRLAHRPGGSKPKRFSAFPIPLGQIERVLQSDASLVEVIDEQFSQTRGHLTYQHPDKIRDAFLLVSDVKDLWNKVAKVLSERAEEGAMIRGPDVHTRLVEIVRRRNKIAHEYDEDPAKAPAKQSIDAATVIQTLDWIEQLAAAILVVLDTSRTQASPSPGAVADR